MSKTTILFDMLKVIEDFREDVKNLPNNLTNRRPYMDFIEKFGTHYTHNMLMGAKSIVHHVVI